MPLYDYECSKCGKVWERYARMDAVVVGCECGGNAKRIIAGRQYVIGNVDYVDTELQHEPVRITSRKQREKLMRENNLTDRSGKGWW